MTEKISLVGAGLVGSLLAIFLARKGLAVELFERRQDMRRHEISAGRSINLAISTRGIFALEKLGLAQTVLSQAVPMKGRMIHAQSGELTFQPYGKDDSQFLNSISRATLNKILMDFAEDTGKVEIFFEHKITGMDFDGLKLKIVDESNKRAFERNAQVVIGTDGSASAIRHDMLKLPGFTADESTLEYGYKELVIPPAAGGGFQLERNALHIWPRGTYMLIALPNLEGSFTCTLFLPFAGAVSFEKLETTEAVEQFFNAQFPDAVPLIPDLVQTFFQNPTGHMVTVKCDPWNVDGKALLMGDAAHGIVPFFGQGMNCGFEDCTILNNCLEQAGAPPYDWSAIFTQVSALRKINTDAIADMAVENFVEMRDKVGDPAFLQQKAVEKVLEKNFPGQYISRYSLVTFSNVPYRLAYDAGLIQSQMLDTLCRDLKQPEDVDLKRAKTLIDEKLAPLFQPHARELASVQSH